MTEKSPVYGSNDEFFEHTNIESALQMAYDDYANYNGDKMSKVLDKEITIYKGYPKDILDSFFIDYETIMGIYTEDGVPDFSLIERRMADTAEEELGEYGEGYLDNITSDDWEDLYYSLAIMFKSIVADFKGTEVSTETERYFDSMFEEVFVKWREKVSFGGASRGFIIEDLTEFNLPLNEVEITLNIPENERLYPQAVAYEKEIRLEGLEK